jgi:hypothetical protein
MILLQATQVPPEALARLVPPALQATLVLLEAPASQVQQVILSKLHPLQFCLPATRMHSISDMCTSFLYNILKEGTQGKRTGCLIHRMYPPLQATLVARASVAPRVSRGQLASLVLLDPLEQQDSPGLLVLLVVLATQERPVTLEHQVLLVQQGIPVSLVRHD